MLRSRKLMSLSVFMGLLALGVGTNARAEYYSLPPSVRVCLYSIYPSTHFEAWGTAQYQAHFTVQRSDDNVNWTTIYNSGTTSAGFHATFDKSYGTTPFPGYFRLCARNTATSTETVNIYYTNVY